MEGERDDDRRRDARETVISRAKLITPEPVRNTFPEHETDTTVLARKCFERRCVARQVEHCGEARALRGHGKVELNLDWFSVLPESRQRLP